MAAQRVVAVLGLGVVPPQRPILRADDLGSLRGDGIFETMHVRDGVAWLRDEHLARLARSAELMQLALPEPSLLVELVQQALSAWPAEVEGALRLVCTRGPEDGDAPPTIFATISAVGEAIWRARRNGVRVATASLGVPADLRTGAPWLLGGAKTLSYAINMASQRWAAGQHADDVLWVSSDGYALEAPTSTLVWLDGTQLCTVPTQTGILAGTTARHLLDHAGDLGWKSQEQLIRPEQLHQTSGAWLTSSVRGVVAITVLDGTPMPMDAANTRQISWLLGYHDGPG